MCVYDDINIEKNKDNNFSLLIWDTENYENRKNEDKRKRKKNTTLKQIFVKDDMISFM